MENTTIILPENTECGHKNMTYAEIAFRCLMDDEPMEFVDWMNCFSILYGSDDQPLKDEYTLWLTNHTELCDVVKKLVDYDDVEEAKSMWNRVILKRTQT